MRRFAVVGSPIDHSLSPLLHRVAYRRLGVRDAEYSRYEVPAGELAAFLTEGPGRSLSALSVTMPGKAEAFAMAVEHDDTSALLGVANTLHRVEGGWRAENHDVHGIAQALRDHGVSRILTLGVLGSGATAASALAAGARLGASEVLVSARDRAKIEQLGPVAQRLGLRLEAVAWERSHQVLEADAVVSALALAGARAVAAAWELRTVPVTARAVLDVLYAPSPPPLTTLLRTRGIETADGLEMLVHQADMQLRAMLGIAQAPTAVMLTAARRAVMDDEQTEAEQAR